MLTKHCQSLIFLLLNPCNGGGLLVEYLILISGNSLEILSTLDQNLFQNYPFFLEFSFLIFEKVILFILYKFMFLLEICANYSFLWVCSYHLSATFEELLTISRKRVSDSPGLDILENNSQNDLVHFEFWDSSILNCGKIIHVHIFSSNYYQEFRGFSES